MMRRASGHAIAAVAAWAVGLACAAGAGRGAAGGVPTQVLRPRALELLGGRSEVVFAVRPPAHDIHWYANFGYWITDPQSRMWTGRRGAVGGELCAVDLRTKQCRTLLSDANGTIRDCRVHYDGRTMLFSWRKGDERHFHLYEIRSDGTGLRQLTDGPWDDFEPCYLPNDEIVFISSRCKRWVPCYLTQVGILYRMRRDGTHMRPISANVEQDNTPAVLPDGRVIYTRWEYTDRSQIDFHGLWTFNPDGTGAMTFYGNMIRGGLMVGARPVPGAPGKVAYTFFSGHSTFDQRGAIVMTDGSAGPDDPNATTRVSPGGPFGWWRCAGPWGDPCPLAEDLVLAAQGMNIVLLGPGGAVQTAYTHRTRVPSAALQEPVPLRPHPRERIIPDRVDWTQRGGRLILADVTRGRSMAGVAPGEVRRLLVLEILPKPVNHSGGSDPLTRRGTFFLQRILGTVPVEADGSAYFEVPALRCLFFVALDANDISVKRMQSFVNVMPGETTGCVGCHERRTDSGPPARNLAALRRPPSRIQPVAGVPEIIDMTRHIQPIVDRHCVGCHNDRKRCGGVSLVGDRGPTFSLSHWALFARRQIVDGGNGVGNTPPRRVGSSASPLVWKIAPDVAGPAAGSGHATPHHDVKLSPLERQLVRLWIDTGAVYAGTYAALGSGEVRVDVFGAPAKYPPDKAVERAAAEALQRRCRSCHAPGRPGKIPGPTSMPAYQPSGGRELSSYFARYVNPASARYSEDSLFDLTRPERSPILLAPLAEAAGGWGACRQLDANGVPGAAADVFADANGADCRAILAAVRKAKARLDEIKRFDMPGFRPTVHYVREMKRYGVLPETLDPNSGSIDIYATDQAYWRSLWYVPAPGAGGAAAAVQPEGR